MLGENEKAFEKVLIDNGYKVEGFGFVNKGKAVTHWVTILNSDSCQMYGYLTNDDEFDKVYDTGIIKIDLDKFQVLVDIFVHYK